MYVKIIQGHTHCPQKCVGVNPFCEYKLTELSRRTYYFDLTSEEWSLGPDFPHGAYGHTTNPPECVQLGNGLVVVHYSPFSQETRNGNQPHQFYPNKAMENLWLMDRTAFY